LVKISIFTFKCTSSFRLRLRLRRDRQFRYWFEKMDL